MILIRNVKLPYGHDDAALTRAAAKALHIHPSQIRSLEILRRSLDCRSKPALYAVYSLAVSCPDESRLLSKKSLAGRIAQYRPVSYRMQIAGTEKLRFRPVIAGSGPAGLFCALELARAGYCPIIAERGKCLEERIRDVEAFHAGGPLNPDSNVQFGEGGAGTFSDGKLSTGVRDRDGRCRRVLSEFVHFGADPDILVSAHPHLGSDVLIRILKNIHHETEANGGTFLFSHRLDDITPGTGDALRLHFSDGSTCETQVLVAALGNGAQDTFRMLREKNIPMQAKSFAAGFRIEHPQEMINRNAYGSAADNPSLPAASYKLTAQIGSRGVYSFCMCPGGYVINASSVPGQTVVNGMSFSGRGGQNANSAIVMTITPADFGSDDPLAALEYQKKIEHRAFSLCSGAVPQQTLRGFRASAADASCGSVVSQIKGQHAFADLRSVFPQEMNEAFLAAMDVFEQKIPGFSDPDAVLSGVESRTSSPVRIIRSESGISSIPQLYPCGEGAGYAGGICSAAMDGLKTAQQIALRYLPLKRGVING